MENWSEDRNLKDFLEEAELLQYHELFRDILKVNKVSQLKFVEPEDLGHIGLSKPEQRRYKKIYGQYFPNYLAKIKKLLTTNKKPDLYLSSPSPITLDTPFTDCTVKVSKHIIPVEDITINSELGSGQFGVVQQGTWTTGNQRLQVAIKCLGHERMTSNSTEFLKEAAVMHSIDHPNIVRLYGVVLHLDSLMLVTELAPLRSLLECLRELSLRSNFPVPSLCEFAEQICDGMAYLENKRLIHRDLAARNILVFSKDRVKISDFGLSRALGVGKDYYQTNYNVNLKLPVAWCAPECILYLKFTSASDVWALGVTLWEMFTYGFQPWKAFSGHQILEAIDAPNFQRLERPECCPEAYYTTMLECWSDDPGNRPKFRELALKLREIRPEIVLACSNFQRPDDPRRSNYLEYKAGQAITVLGKENITKNSMWFGVVAGGACGVFDPADTKPPPPKSSLSPRTPLLRSDVKRHTYTGKRTLQRSMISSPQGEVKHTGHVGLDGAYFGDISFLDPAGCPPRQVVTPYKPSEDLEQMPLINPNSPSHLTADPALPPYPLLSDKKTNADAKQKTLKRPTLKPVAAPTTSKSILNKVKSATLGRSFRSDDGTHASTSRADEDHHEYHEISDTDTESNPTDHVKTDKLVPPDSPSVPKTNVVDLFGKSLLEELDTVYRSFNAGRASDNRASGNLDNAARSHTLNKQEKKKGFHTNTMKPMSAHDQKTLDTACALANEITTRSMNDLGTENGKVPPSPGEKMKFHFKFPSLHHHSHQDPEHRGNAVNQGKQERRNFSEEANSVPDIQASLTEESKLAYMSLIEQPGSMGCQAVATPRRRDELASSLLRDRSSPPRDHGREYTFRNQDVRDGVMMKNEVPVPPRTTMTKLVDKPRHIRKYPLLTLEVTCETSEPAPRLPAVYQNFSSCVSEARSVPAHSRVYYQNLDSGVDVCDGAAGGAAHTNPFTSNAGASTSASASASTSASASANPFNSYMEPLADNDAQYIEAGFLVKECADRVSVEDLLEFADHKPDGRQRGAESDEVRVISKVLKNEVSTEDSLEALELCSWNVYQAIKVLRVRLTSARGETLETCARALNAASGDVVRACKELRRAPT